MHVASGRRRRGAVRFRQVKNFKPAVSVAMPTRQGFSIDVDETDVVEYIPSAGDGEEKRRQHTRPKQKEGDGKDRRGHCRAEQKQPVDRDEPPSVVRFPDERRDKSERRP